MNIMIPYKIKINDDDGRIALIDLTMTDVMIDYAQLFVFELY